MKIFEQDYKKNDKFSFKFIHTLFFFYLFLVTYKKIAGKKIFVQVFIVKKGFLHCKIL